MVAFALVASMMPAQAQDPPGVDDAGTVEVMVSAPDSVVAALDSMQAVEAHPQDSPTGRGFLIVTPDGRNSLRLRGSIRLNGGYDFNGLLGKSTFSTVDIPVTAADTGETSFFMQAAQTRFGIDITQDTPVGEGFLRVEMDFLGAGNTARLRHAYGSVGVLLAGQTWSTFSDVGSLPLTVDLDGPNSSVAERTVQARFTFDTSDHMRIAVGIESPTAEVTELDTLRVRPAFQTFPDMVATLRGAGGWGHIKGSGVVRSISVRKQDGNLDVLAAYGAMASGRVGLPSDDELLFQAWGGEGIGKFITAFAGRNFDAVFNPDTGEFELIPVYGGFVSWNSSWFQGLNSYFTAGLVYVDNKDFETDDAFHSSQYLSGNIFWEATAGTRFGAEYTWGRRENKSGDDGIANRVSFIIYYDF
jgi:hypothetical protein